MMTKRVLAHCDTGNMSMAPPLIICIGLSTLVPYKSLANITNELKKKSLNFFSKMNEFLSLYLIYRFPVRKK